MKKNFLTVQDMALMAVFVALMAVCSWISIPIGPVPFTLQTFAVFATAGLLGTKRGTIAVVVYILLGLVGAPVFSQFTAGPGVLAGPTGGYIIGFIFTALIIGVITDLFQKSKPWSNIIMMVIAMILGDIVCFVIGTIQFMYVAGTGLAESLTLCVIPYIIPDMIKIVVATIIVDRIKQYVRLFH